MFILYFHKLKLKFTLTSFRFYLIIFFMLIFKLMHFIIIYWVFLIFFRLTFTFHGQNTLISKSMFFKYDLIPKKSSFIYIFYSFNLTTHIFKIYCQLR